MHNQSPTPAFTPPTPADYKALVDRIAATLQSRAAGEIDARAFGRCIDQICAEARTLDLLGKLHRACLRLAARQQKASQPPASS